MKTLKTLALLALISLASCKQEAPENKVFTSNEPDSEAYKAELAKKITAGGNLTYTFDSLEIVGGHGKIHVLVNGDGVDAKAAVAVHEGDAVITPFLNSKGKGYGGAELKGLKINVHQTDGRTEFIYNGVDEVID